MRFIIRCVLLFLLIGGLSQSIVAQSETTVYLFRHAEKLSIGNDPSLTEAGHERANHLLTVINAVKVDHVYSTPLNRTVETALPIAQYFGLEIENYDHRDLSAFAKQLLDTPGTHVVSGHSNTTPALVSALTGADIAPIDENEYDNLYIVQKSVSGDVVWTQVKFAPFFKPRN